MIDIAYDEVFPAPRDAVWRLLDAHRDDAVIPRIHPLVLRQTTVRTDRDETLVDRLVDARGRQLSSRWRLTNRPPDYARWEVIEGPGPWAPGSYIENRYTEAPGGTRIVSTGRLHISILPSFLPQGWFARRVLGDIDAEDARFLRASTPP